MIFVKTGSLLSIFTVFLGIGDTKYLSQVSQIPQIFTHTLIGRVADLCHRLTVGLDHFDHDIERCRPQIIRQIRADPKAQLHATLESTEEFQQKIKEEAFVEYEEVYAGCYYGTLKSEIERIEQKGHHVVFDVDVVGGCNLKRIFADKALSVFIAPPDVQTLRKRLEGRGTDAPEMIEQRVGKAEYELTFAPKFDTILVNDDLTTALQEADEIIKNFLGK